MKRNRHLGHQCPIPAPAFSGRVESLRQSPKRLLNALFIIFSLCLITACSTTDTQTQSQERKKSTVPQPETISLKRPKTNAPGEDRYIVVKKDLFAIELKQKKIYVNGVSVKNRSALVDFLDQYELPMLTLSAHRCAKNSAEILSLLQTFTDTPITYSAFGDYTDAECE